MKAETIEGIKERQAKLEVAIGGAAKEQTDLRLQLTRALAAGEDLGKLQRRLGELEVLIAAGPEARKLLALELNKALAAAAKPRIAGVLDEIKNFRGRIEAAAKLVTAAWDGLEICLDPLRDLALPPWAGIGLKVMLDRDRSKDHTMQGHIPGERELAEEGIGSLKSQLFEYTMTWELALTKVLAHLEEPPPAGEPLSQRELVKEHFKIVTGEGY